jgi:Na+-driven multidrug efflux pump
MSTTELQRKTFYKTMIGIGAPIAIQQLIGSSLNLVDTLMIGKLGEDAIAAVGIANRLFFCLYYSFMVLIVGVVFLLHNIGERRIKAIYIGF